MDRGGLFLSGRDDKKGQAIETNMHEKAWGVFTLAYVFAFFLSYRICEDIALPISSIRLN